MAAAGAAQIDLAGCITDHFNSIAFVFVVGCARATSLDWPFPPLSLSLSGTQSRAARFYAIHLLRPRCRRWLSIESKMAQRETRTLAFYLFCSVFTWLACELINFYLVFSVLSLSLGSRWGKSNQKPFQLNFHLSISHSSQLKSNRVCVCARCLVELQNAGGLSTTLAHEIRVQPARLNCLEWARVAQCAPREMMNGI